LHTAQPGLAHQPAGLFPAQFPAAPCHRLMHLFDPVNRVVLAVHGNQVGDELLVADLAI
jgi:hypothetical protein